ncbi:MAG: hypothetical protein KF726_25235 [Anaerolineae bacterium]|nr:hypothetical protein [Anaerolineae bacterium]
MAEKAAAKPNKLEEIAAGCTLSWYDNGIIGIHITSNDRTVVDAWAKRSMEIRQAWAPETPIYLLLDVHDTTHTLNPYARTKTLEIMRTRPDVTSFVGAVLPQSPIALLLVTFSKTLNALNPRGQMMFCYSFEEAWQWLVGCIERDKRELTSR